MEIPYSLQPSLKALEALSYNLKQKNQKMKRNIRFDDMAKDLALDFNTDPETSSWRRVSGAQALQVKNQLSRGKTQDITSAMS